MKLLATALVALVLLATGVPAGASPDGQITWAVHTTLVPTYFDPAETTIITSFMVLYALHDGVVKPMPGKPLGYLQGVGIRAKLRPLERAAFNKSIAEKKLRNLVQIIGGAFGNAATRLEAYVVSGGQFAYGGYPDVDGLFREQATELDRARREAVLHRMQQIVHDKAMVAPMYELAFVNGVGRRVAESGLGLIASYAFSAPYEDLRLKAQ